MARCKGKFLYSNCLAVDSSVDIFNYSKVRNIPRIDTENEGKQAVLFGLHLSLNVKVGLDVLLANGQVISHFITNRSRLSSISFLKVDD